MKLLENETVLNELSEIVVTNLRVYKQSKEHLSVIPIKQIASVELKNNSYPVLLALGVTLLIGAAFIFLNNEPNDTVSPIALIVGLILIGSYFTTMKFVISINSSDGVKIISTGKGTQKEVIEIFINAIINASSK